MLARNTARYLKILGTVLTALRGPQACLGRAIEGEGQIGLPRKKVSGSSSGSKRLSMNWRLAVIHEASGKTPRRWCKQVRAL